MELGLSVLFESARGALVLVGIVAGLARFEVAESFESESSFIATGAIC